MISRVRGKLLRRDTDAVEIMTSGGVGYEVEIPLFVFEKLPRLGGEVELLTYQVVREDDLLLFGFADEAERTLFGRLLGASGVGPRLALAMMSSLAPARLVRAITDREIGMLTQVPGVGKKTAERIALELGDKLDDLALTTAAPKPEGRAAEDAVGALVSLGYSVADATGAVRRSIEEAGPTEDAQLLIRRVLAKAGT